MLDGRRDDSLAWYALQTASRSERTTADYLTRKGFEVLLPLERNSARRSVPALFPGYLFCRLDATAPLPVLITPGVRSLVGYGKTAIPLSEDEVCAIQALAGADIDVEAWPRLCLGQAVTIVRGPLSGLTATLARVRNEKRISVNVSLLQRSVLLDIPLDHVTPLIAA